jgi:hypothetical protein
MGSEAAASSTSKGCCNFKCTERLYTNAVFKAQHQKYMNDNASADPSRRALVIFNMIKESKLLHSVPMGPVTNHVFAKPWGSL